MHVQVFRESLNENVKPETIPGHPVYTFIRENRAVENVIANTQPIFEEITQAEDGEEIGALLQQWREKHQQLREIDIRFSRKENVLFPYLEKRGITGPSSVMWGIHDDIRGELKKVQAFLDAAEPVTGPEIRRTIQEVALPLFHTIKGLIYKEKNIMFPTALQLLSEQDWAEIFRQSDEIGYTPDYAGETMAAAGRGRGYKERSRGCAGTNPPGSRRNDPKGNRAHAQHPAL